MKLDGARLQSFAPQGAIVSTESEGSHTVLVRLIAPRGQIFALGGKGRQRVCEIEPELADSANYVYRVMREYFECLVPVEPGARR